MPRTLAQKYLEDLHIEKGHNLSVLVKGAERQNIPEDFYQDATKPVRLDFLGGRPTNAVCDDQGFQIDLCFSGPPQRCEFIWADVLAISTDPQAMQWIAVSLVTTVLLMEDGTATVILPKEQGVDPDDIEDLEDLDDDDTKPETPLPKELKKKPRPSFLKVVK